MKYFVKDNMNSILNSFKGGSNKVSVNKVYRNVYVCLDCGQVFVLREDTNIYCREYVCDVCFEDYVTCEDCGEVVRMREAFCVGDYRVCESCFYDYAVCERCCEYIHYEDAVQIEDDSYCRSCADRESYTYCECCNARIYLGNSFEYDDCYYCESCYNNIDRVIMDYSYKPVPIFLKMDYEPNNNKEFFGFEIEVEGDRDYAEEFLYTVNKDHEIVYLKQDSSVDGFEIVTHPMTRTFFYEKFTPALKEGMSYLIENDFRGHNAGGIHIHVSKDALSCNQLRHLTNLLYPKNNNDYYDWLKITQRKENKMKRWSSMNTFQDNNERHNHLKHFKEGVKPLTQERYTAMNICCNTVEFRIFNSNLRIERIIKNAEVIFSLIDFSNAINRRHDFKGFLKYISSNKYSYKYLYSFLLEKNLINDDNNNCDIRIITTGNNSNNEEDLICA